jgi:type IV pilus assembly protein PilC
MSSYAYVAVDPQGSEMRGTLEVPDQFEALRRIKEMGLFPTKVWTPRTGQPGARRQTAVSRPRRAAARRGGVLSMTLFPARIKPAQLTVFTRQLATLVEAGLPLLRGLRLLEQQEENRTLKQVIGNLSDEIENGGSLAEAIALHPKIFNRLYVNMVRAGEIGGALEITLRRLAEFMEKAQRIKGKVKSALYYPAAVLVVALGIVVLLMTFIVPRFRDVFESLLNGAAMPAFTLFIFKLSTAVKNHVAMAGATLAGGGVLFALAMKTAWGRWSFDRFKLAMPVVGPLFRKAAISRFARTLGTLASNGVPVLQALTIVKETAGSIAVGQLILRVHDNVKQGEPIAPTLRASPLFPAMVAGMVDVGEQTGALPEMLMKIADTYDEEVENAANAMTSLLEPVLLVFLAVVVGSIVIAMFLPILHATTHLSDPNADGVN